MLETVVAHLYDKCKPEDKDTILAMPSQPRPQTGKKAPTIFQKWNSQPKWEAETGANENGWMLKCTDQHSGQSKYFNDFNTAALWVIKYIARNVLFHLLACEDILCKDYFRFCVCFVHIHRFVAPR